MALSKPVATPFGIAATYHMIASVQIHYREGCCDVVLASFVDEPLRRSGALPLGTLPPMRLVLDELDGAADPTRGAIYAALKRLDAWADAADA